MKKAIVIGGSNGIGLAISLNLIDKGYYINVLDRVPPDEGVLSDEKYIYYYFDLLDMDQEVINSFTSDAEISMLIITAGIGRVTAFENMHSTEICKIMNVNATSTICLIRMFFERIKSHKAFYCGVYGSISGMLSTPLAAVYAASKAAVFRFVESVNIELEISGTPNRILNIAPAAIKGTKFYGGSNKVDLLVELAEQTVQHLLCRSEIYIPQYDEVYKDVLVRYHNDPHEYGLHSYEYKLKSGRVDNSNHFLVGYLSGTFDLFHIGHLNLLKRAKQMCDYLIVGVHKSGAWKGKETFIPFDERKAILSSCKYVDQVVDSFPEDSEAWEKWHYDLLFVGSDYKGTERFQKYERFFSTKKVKIVYFPYTQGTSSTQIRELIDKKSRASVLHSAGDEDEAK